jgi:hypothetical protein
VPAPRVGDHAYRQRQLRRHVAKDMRVVADAVDEDKRRPIAAPVEAVQADAA